MARFWSSQTCVMPTFSPTIALVAMCCSPVCLHANASHGRTRRGIGSVVPWGSRRRPRTSVWRTCRVYSACSGRQIAGRSCLGLLDLDLDLDVGGELEA